MTFIYLISGLLIGAIITYLLNKTNSVSKKDYESLNIKFNEANTQQKVAEEKFSSHQQEYLKVNLKLETKESELSVLYSKSSSLETTVKNYEAKISDLSESLKDSNNSNTKLQNEINSLKQTLSEESANNNSLKENLKSQNEKTEKQIEQINTLTEKTTKLTSENSTLIAKYSAIEENYGTLKETNQAQHEQVKQLTEKVNKLNSENSTLIANNTALNERLSNQKEEIIEIQKLSQLQFEKIANQILEEKSGKFTESNKTNIEALLKPLGENIDIFKKKVEETYDKESKERFSLQDRVKELIEQTNKVSAEANNLATALKGQAKKQGNWGEMILESILQKSGLERDREYFLQPNIKDDDGNNLRPDVLVQLPDNRMIIIDSKVSLVAYDRFSAADTIEEQALHLTEHIKSIYNHIDNLQSKKYDNLEKALDFTMMFIPIEPAYLVSIQNDQELWAYAYSKRILLISPTNLIACLKLMADLWKRELQSKNAQEIVKRGELLYDKFVGFVSTLEDMGKHIEKTQKSYDSAIGQLNSGRGNLIDSASKLKKLGLKSSKEIPLNMLPKDFEPEESDEKPSDENNIV